MIIDEQTDLSYLDHLTALPPEELAAVAEMAPGAPMFARAMGEAGTYGMHRQPWWYDEHTVTEGHRQIARCLAYRWKRLGVTRPERML